MQIPSIMRIVLAILLSLGLALRGIRKKNLTKDGAFAAVIISSPLLSMNPAFGLLLIIFYLVGSRVTHYKSYEKRRQEECSTARNWYQVFCSSILLLWCSISYFSDVNSRTISSLVALACIACACGDTFASEIGSVSNETPILITTLSKAIPGQNGGISITGTISSIFSGLFIGFCYYILMFIFPSDLFPLQATQCIIIGSFSGFVGSMVDSFLGATMQGTYYDEDRKIIVYKANNSAKLIGGYPVLSNETVNLLSAFITSVLVYVIFHHRILKNIAES